jgi:hypothetical protein
MWMIRFQINWSTLEEIFQLGRDQGFLNSEFWSRVTSQWGLLLSFSIGSLTVAAVMALAAYPLSLRGIKFYRAHRK